MPPLIQQICILSMFNLFQSLTPTNYLKYETLLELIGEFSTACDTKISLQKSVVSKYKV